MTEVAERAGRGPAAQVAPTDNRRIIADLVGAKARFLVPMIVAYMVGYIGLTILASFAKGFVAQKVAGALNVGFLLIAGNYVLSWVIALVYVRIANRTFDPMVARAVAGKSAAGGRQ